MVRKKNEDNFFVGNQINEEGSSELEVFHIMENIQQWKFYAVFDGIGGIEHGELASRFAAETAKELSLKLKDGMDYVQVDEIVQKIFLEANNKVVMARKNMTVCGTTGTLLATDGIVAKVYHVGDSRAYLLREENLFQITKDQTLAQLKVDSGFYKTVKDAEEREQHQLTEYIGRDESMQYFRSIESEWFDFRIDDQILICSDGLYDQCDAGQLKKVLLKQEKANEKITQLIDIVKRNGARDNITCILVKKCKKN